MIGRRRRGIDILRNNCKLGYYPHIGSQKTVIFELSQYEQHLNYSYSAKSLISPKNGCGSCAVTLAQVCGSGSTPRLLRDDRALKHSLEKCATRARKRTKHRSDLHIAGIGTGIAKHNDAENT